MPDKPIPLHYSFQPIVDWNLSPGQIIVTTDSLYEVQNELRFNIRNPEGQPVINFANKDGLTPSSDLPPITAPQAWPKPVDRLYLRFPWCDKLPVQCSGMLTTRLYSTSVICEPTPATKERWYTQVMSDPQFGRYWIIFPKSQDVQLGPGESIQFLITGIITYINAGTTTEIYIKPNVEGYISEDAAVAPVHLTDPPPSIRFDAPTGTVAPGSKVVLTWATLNAKECTLVPVDGGTKPVPTQAPAPDGYAVYPLKTTTYTLTATNPIGVPRAASVTVNVKSVSIASFKAKPPEDVRLGDPVALEWVTENAVTCEIWPDVGIVCQNATCGRGSRTVTPGAFTTYTLRAEGQDGPATAKAVVFPLRNNWSTTTTDAPWTSSARPVLISHRLPQADAPSLWLLTGDTAGPNWVYRSEDGALWAPATNKASYPPRKNAVGASFRGQMWLMGGEDNLGNRLNDVWTSSDGSNWTPVHATSIWPSRSRFGCAVFKEKLWVVGGMGQSGPLGDAWSTTDGTTWVKQSGSLPEGVTDFGTAAYNGRLKVVAGRVGVTQAITNKIYSTEDGSKWELESGIKDQLTPRALPSVLVYRDMLFVYGGYNPNPLNDGWYSGLGGWAPLPAPPAGWQKVNAGFGQMQGALWLAGGEAQPGVANKQVLVFAPPTDTPNTGQLVEYSQPQPGEICFIVSCDGFAFPTQEDPGAESWVTFTSSDKKVALPLTLIRQDRFLVGVRAAVNGGWTTTFHVEYGSNRPLRPGFRVRFYPAYLPGGPQGGNQVG